jgi:hypothetical protein
MIRLSDILNEADKRIARKKGQHKGSNKHSDLYTDENPKGTIHGLKFATVKDAEASVNKIKSSGKSHAHKIQAAIAMEQRAKAAGKTTAAGVYRSYINSIKKSEIKLLDLLNEANKKEYIIWGVPPGQRYEDVLYTKADSLAEAKRVMDILKNEHGCTKLRVQVLDLSKELDLKKTFGSTVKKR